MPIQVAKTVAVCITEAARIDFVNYRVPPPWFWGLGRGRTFRHDGSRTLNDPLLHANTQRRERQSGDCQACFD